MPQDIFNPDALTRDLAGLYASGKIHLDEYLTLWEDLLATMVGGNDNQNAVAV